MRVLGVDPGLTRCGLGIVEGELGAPLRMIAVGVVRTPTSDDPAMRLLTLQIEIDSWIARYQPDVVAVERVFAKANIKGIMGTAQASAVPMLAAARLGLPLAMHTPTEVKASVTGNGRADKAQVTEMVTRILRLDTRPRPADAADALALAICQLWRGTAQNRLRDAAAQLGRQRPAPERPAPELSAPERSAPELSAPERSAPELSAPELSAPERSAPLEVAAPQRSAPRAPAPGQTRAAGIR